MYYVVNYKNNEVHQYSDLDGVQPAPWCDWFTLMPLLYGQTLILGHDHSIENKSETDAYFGTLERSREDANEHIAYMLSRYYGIRVYISQDDAIKNLKKLVDDFTVENPNADNLEHLHFFKSILQRIQAFKE